MTGLLTGLSVGLILVLTVWDGRVSAVPLAMIVFIICGSALAGLILGDLIKQGKKRKVKR